MTTNANEPATEAKKLIAEIKWDENGLAPAIVQDSASKDILMMAYMNRESLQATLTTGETVFWSRSRQELWHKGSTSGNVQKVKSIAYDCDADTLLVKVTPAGPACHNGTYTCFTNVVPLQAEGGAFYGDRYEDNPFDSTAAAEGGDRFAILSLLESTIAQRDVERPAGTYTTSLFEKGLDKILKKIGEEASEVIIAAKNPDRQELRYETADLLFHLLVLLREARLPLDDVMRELDRRHNKKPKE